MEKEKNEKTYGTVFDNIVRPSFVRRTHDIRVKKTPDYRGLFFLSDNLLRARRKCRCSVGGISRIRFGKQGINYLLSMRCRKFSERLYQELENEK